MRSLASRRPFVFSLLLVAALLLITYASRIVFPRQPVGDLTQLPSSAFREPSQIERALEALQSPEGLYGILSIALAVALLAAFGWWREAGFNRPSRWRNLHLLWFPILVTGIALSDGIRAPEGPGDLTSTLLAVLIAVFGEEIVFRGLMWRVLVPRGVLPAAVTTSLLAGAVTYAINATGGPVPEARYITALAACGGFAYAALRWRTASLWPVIIAHFLLALALDVSSLGSDTYQVLLYLGTLGSVAYGLFLLRTARVRADGG